MTDQPSEGSEGSAATPFNTFLASIGTCAGIYVLGFCRQRNIPTEGLKLIQRHDVDPATGMVRKVHIEIQLPPGFPEKYREAAIRAADQCKVKKHVLHPPEFEINTTTGEPVPA